MYLYNLIISYHQSYHSISALKKTADNICLFLMLSAIKTNKTRKTNIALALVHKLLGTFCPTGFLISGLH